MKCKFFGITMLVLALSAALSGCTMGAIPVPTTTASLADVPSYKIDIIGGNASPVTVTYADLMAMAMVEKDHVTMVKANGAEVTSDFVGVPMAEILEKAGAPEGDVTFKLSAPDGYAMVYTRQQLENSILGLKKNGTVLTDDMNNNPIQMVVAGERGAMWMKVPVKIEVLKE